MEPADTYAYLLGRWSVERTVVDRHGGSGGRFSGTAEARPTGETGSTAAYVEDGCFVTAGRSWPAQRRLLYRRLPSGAVAMDFADGRPFIQCDLSGGRWACEHLCGPDVYRMEYEALGPDALIERWDVSGPAKDYRAETTLARLARPD